MPGGVGGVRASLASTRFCERRGVQLPPATHPRLMGDRFCRLTGPAAHDRVGDDPAVRRRDGPDRARDERSVAIPIARSALSRGWKRSSARGVRLARGRSRRPIRQRGTRARCSNGVADGRGAPPPDRRECVCRAGDAPHDRDRSKTSSARRVTWNARWASAADKFRMVGRSSAHDPWHTPRLPVACLQRINAGVPK